MGRVIPLLALCACGPGTAGPDQPPADPGLAEITSAELNCDEEAGLWTLDVVTSAWTRGALSAWTEDGSYVELHDLTRLEWAEDGSREVLRLRMPIVDDWREVTDTTTVFTCARDPSGVLEVLDLEGNVAGCRAWGPDPSLFDELPDTPSCADPIDRY